jgi:hypothetical protein
MKIIGVFIVYFMFAISNYAVSIELEWHMKNDTNVTGYSFTMWTESGVAVTTKLGKINTVRINTLKEGKRYIFQITPLNENGPTGEKSNIVIYDVPPIRTLEIEGRPQLKIKSKLPEQKY